jgi:HEAT repeat protein
MVCVGAMAAAAGLAAAQPQWQDVIRNLRHPDAGTRLEAVERLARGNYVAAIEPVAALIRDPDDRVQTAALDAELTFFLSDRVNDRRVLGFGGRRSRAQQAFDAGPLVRTASPAPAALIDALIAAMRDENARVRFDAVHALGFVAEAPLAPAHAEALAAELEHYDPIVRAATARVFGRLRQRSAGERLLNALDDSSPIVREFAAEALGLVREDRAAARLRGLVARAGGQNVDGLVLALARIGSPDDLALFRQQLTARSPGARRAGAEGVGRVGDRDATNTLRQMLAGDRASEVRLAAAFALHLLGETQSHVIAASLGTESAQARDYLFEIGRAAVPGIHSALKVATDPRHRADLIQTVGYLGSAEHVALVEPFLRDREERVVSAATAAALRLRRAR